MEAVSLTDLPLGSDGQSQEITQAIVNLPSAQTIQLQAI